MFEVGYNERIKRYNRSGSELVVEGNKCASIGPLRVKS